ncbi:MAG: hypothetical protein R3E74_11140 [Pseudomonadales bacterium]
MLGATRDTRQLMRAVPIAYAMFSHVIPNASCAALEARFRNYAVGG